MSEAEQHIRPIQTFTDNIRPAKLMLDVHRLLDCGDSIMTAGEIVERLRLFVGASASEDLMVVQNEVFLGLVRERAHMPKASLKSPALAHLLRQAVVASCTALDAFLPGLLRLHLPVVMERRGRDFIPRDDTVKEYFKDLTFDVHEVVRLLDDAHEARVYIANRLLGHSEFRVLANRKGVHVVGSLLGLTTPWDDIAAHLGRDKQELMRVLDETVKRRNDIVHRADRFPSDPDGDQQSISYPYAKQGVDTVETVCLALDELVERSEMTTSSAPEIQ
jgi:hypothetical protein